MLLPHDWILILLYYSPRSQATLFRSFTSQQTSLVSWQLLLCLNAVWSLPVLVGYAPPIFIGINGALWLSCGLNFLLSAGTVGLRSPVTAVDYSFSVLSYSFKIIVLERTLVIRDDVLLMGWSPAFWTSTFSSLCSNFHLLSQFCHLELREQHLFRQIFVLGEYKKKMSSHKSVSHLQGCEIGKTSFSDLGSLSK